MCPDNLTAVPGTVGDCVFVTLRKPTIAVAKLSVGEVDQTGDPLVRGTNTTYTIVVSNAGLDAVTGATLRDPSGSREGLTCTAPPTCSGAACPVGPALAQLESGATPGTLAMGATVTVTLSCTAN